MSHCSRDGVLLGAREGIRWPSMVLSVACGTRVRSSSTRCRAIEGWHVTWDGAIISGITRCVGGDGMRPPICVAEATISGDERAHHEVSVHRLHQAPCVASASHRAALCATSTGPACPYMPPLPDATRSGCSEQVGQPSRASDRRCMPLHISSASRHAGGLLRARRLATMGCSQDVLLED
jgi:hypothetical protein